MKTYNYNTVTKANTIELSDEWVELLELLDKQEALQERRETRRHTANVYTKFGELSETREHAMVTPDFIAIDEAEQEVTEIEKEIPEHFEKLPEKYHPIYFFWYLRKKNTVQIAKLTGIPQRTVSRWIDKIRSLLGL